MVTGVAGPEEAAASPRGFNEHPAPPKVRSFISNAVKVGMDLNPGAHPPGTCYLLDFGLLDYFIDREITPIRVLAVEQRRRNPHFICHTNFHNSILMD